MNNSTLFINPDHLPGFSSIDVEQIKEQLLLRLNNNRAEVDRLLDESGEKPSWDNIVEPLESMADELQQFWAPISHLNGVMNSERLRAVYDACLPELSAYATELGQNEKLFRVFEQLSSEADEQGLDVSQRKLIANELRDFRLSGIALDPDNRKRFAEIKAALSKLGSEFSNHVLDATQAWQKHIRDATELLGLPASVLASLHQAARAKGKDGYLLTLDLPIYLPLMMYCENRALREELYVAYCTRASSEGPGDPALNNDEHMLKILSLRQELAGLLGYDNYVEYSLATKMASSADEAIGFLRELAEQSLPVARQDFADLQQFARDEHGVDQLQAWDIPFYSEKLRLDRYAISQEELRPYFPADTVLAGMFKVVERLYGLDVREVSGVDVWHPDARYFEVHRDGQLIAAFYVDLYARDKKRGGAWMADCRPRRRLGKVLQTPVAFLVCNFTPPTEEQPSLLTHNEVTTLFHEFGHGLHHMLTEIDVMGVSGINGVEWDAVELPSQIMENWCWEKEVIPLISSHYQSGEPLPVDKLDKLLAAKNFQSGMQMVRQLEFALFDLLVHRDKTIKNAEDIQRVLDSVRQEVAVYSVPAYNRFQNSFAHIFSGGYAAGYYSYKWAEVLSADAFSLFEETGVFSRESGEQFLQNILSRGGSEPAMTLFTRYRGRPPQTDALLRHSGISPAVIQAAQ